MLVIQHLHTTWTKASRGMPGAGVRNAVPRALPLALPDAAADEVCLHHVAFDERDAFAARGRTESLQRARSYWSLTIDREGDAFILSFAYDPSRHGLPLRHTVPRRNRLFTLARGQTARFHINGRFSYESQWYEQHCLNLAHVAKPDLALFVDRAPDHVVDLNAALF